jgi:hypothetical protein
MECAYFNVLLMFSELRSAIFSIAKEKQKKQKEKEEKEEAEGKRKMRRNYEKEL